MVVKIMKKEIKNLDQFYSTVKSAVGELKVVGWDARYTGTKIFSKTGSVLGWFLENYHKLKRGCKDTLIAEARGNGNYAVHNDCIYVSSTPTKEGILVKLVIRKYYDKGPKDYSGQYNVWSDERTDFFLLNNSGAVL